MEATTIKIYNETKHELDTLRESKNESYDEIIKKMMFIVRNVEKKPKLSKDTIKAIASARERIKQGKFVTETEARKRLGL